MKRRALQVRTLDQITRWVSGIVLTAIIFVMLAPVAVTLLQSVSESRVFSFPPTEFGLRQYTELFGSDTWMTALLLSLRLGAAVTMVSSLIVVPALLAIYRSELRWRFVIQSLGVAGIVIPISAYAVALYGLYVQTGLLGTFWGLVLGHTALAVPIMLLVGSAAMSKMPIDLELAAMVAGASRARAWFGITLRLLLPAIFAGAILAFITSFDEAVLVVFVGGQGLETLPRAILNTVRIGIDPLVTAVATLLMAGTSVLMALALSLNRKAGQ